MNAAVKAEQITMLDLEPFPDKLPVVQPPSAVAVNSPAGVMLAALAQGATLEQVEKMMDLQERWEKREAEKAFADAFAAFRGENIIIPKGKFVDRGKAGSFHQAEFDDACRRLSPALSRHGFGFRHDQRFGVVRRMHDGAESDVGWVWVTCFLEHKAGHTKSLELEGPPGDLSANTPVQNMQATATYLKRQSLLAITGTATGGEDDESKLRKSAANEAKSEAIDEQRKAGEAAAQEGLARLTAWWKTLDAKQQAALSKEFGDMRKTARRVDEGAAQ